MRETILSVGLVVLFGLGLLALGRSGEDFVQSMAYHQVMKEEAERQRADNDAAHRHLHEHGIEHFHEDGNE